MTLIMKPPADGWAGIDKRRRAFCDAFVREHHPDMIEDQLPKSKDVHPLVPLGGPGVSYHRITGGDWWLNTNDSMSALGGVYIGYLFKHRNLFDHAWIIGRSDQEPWAVVSEPYSQGDDTPALIADLRIKLEHVGVELIEYPPEQSTHSPGPGIHVLVANIVSIHTLMGAVARYIAGQCARPRVEVL